MARCGACGAEFSGTVDLLLARNKDDQWVLMCRPCHNKGVRPDELAPPPPAADPAATTAMSAFASGDTAMMGPVPPLDSFAAVGVVLAQLRSQRKKDLLRPHTRIHERHSVDLAIRFHLARDDVYHNGLVNDLSGGGLQMITEHPLEKGQLIHFDSQMPLPAVLLEIFQGAAEVRRVRLQADGRYAAGVRFVQRQAAKGSNRRRFRRYATRLLALYQRERSDILTMADAVDISQGGVMLRAHEKINLGESFAIRLRGNSGSFARGDLVGVVRVLRALERPDHFEIGCQFAETRIEPRRFEPPRPTTTIVTPPS